MSKKVIKKEWKLPKKFKTKWVKALRSGEYQQTTGSLYDKTENAYCCLGVAGRVCGLNPDEMAGHGTFNDLNLNTNIPDSLPLILRPKHEDEGILAGKLMDLNDQKQMSFKWIASYIERNL